MQSKKYYGINSKAENQPIPKYGSIQKCSNKKVWNK